MDKQHFAVYKKKGDAVTKDGHTMFIEDVVKDLNRKSYLESKLAESPWISVEGEGIPFDASYLCTNGKIVIELFRFRASGYEIPFAGSYDDLDSFVAGITHYMPLPAPLVK